MSRTLLISLIVAPLLMSGCHSAHVEPPEAPVRPHVPVREGPVRPHLPAPAAPAEVDRGQVTAEMQRLAEGKSWQAINFVCGVNERYETLTGEAEDQISSMSGKLGVPRPALLKLANDLRYDQLSGNDIKGAAAEELCSRAAENS